MQVRMGLHTGPAVPAGADYATTHTLTIPVTLNPPVPMCLSQPSTNSQPASLISEAAKAFGRDRRPP